MSLANGSNLGSYTIVGAIGAGGMGEVYRARDRRLGRDVAIKVLPAQFAADPERLARFEREAQLLAGLNHPNIAQVHGLEESGGVRALVMELVEGDTLADRIARGPLPVDEAISVAREIAEAMQYAHDQGVIHRDLKPANVKLTADGTVKVLDFGLAKALGGEEGADSNPDATHSPTITAHHTRAGVILGTAAYMSPEQARGRRVDRRSDIWSFGCVLYECLTGKQAFTGETVSDTISLILQREPDWAALPAETPAGVRRLLRHCLEKDARKRLRDIGDARFDLDESGGGEATAAAARAAGWPRGRVLALCAGVLVAGASIGFALRGARGPAPGAGGTDAGGPVRVSIVPPDGMDVRGMGLLPDGQGIVMVASERSAAPGAAPPARLYVRALDDFEYRVLPGTDGVRSWTYSADSRWLAFEAPASADSRETILFKVPVDGSSPAVTVARLKEQWGMPCWLPGGDLLVLTGLTPGAQAYVRIPAGGGTAGPERRMRGYTRLGARWAEPLPDGEAVLMTLEGWEADGYHIRVGLLDLRTDSLRVLVEDGGGAEYASTGHVVFSRADALMAVPFDVPARRVTGEPRALFAGLRTSNVWSHGSFFLADNGTLMYTPGQKSGADRRVVWIGERGEVTEAWTERRPFEAVSLSPDARRAVVTIADARGLFQAWLGEMDRPSLRPLVVFPGADVGGAVWSGDGRYLAVQRVGFTPEDGVYVVDLVSGGEPQRVAAPESTSVVYGPTSWLPDGLRLVAMRFAGGAREGQIALVSRDGASPPRILAGAAGTIGFASVSPDGRWLLVRSTVTGREEIYVAPFDSERGPGALVRVSDGVAANIVETWRGPSEILFVDTRQRLQSVRVSGGATPSVTAPTPLADIDALRVVGPQVSPSADGRLLAVQRGESERDVHHRHLVLHWLDDLREKTSAR